MEWTRSINWADVVAIIILLRSTYVGSQRGFFGELFYAFGFLVTTILTLHFYAVVSNFLNKYLFIPLKFSNLISFLIISIGIYFCFGFIHGFLAKIIKVEAYPPINKTGGPLFGLCKGFIMTAIFFMLLLLIPINYVIESAKTRSLLGPFFVRNGVALYQRGITMIPNAEPRDLSGLLSGAEPLSFRMFGPKEEKADEIPD